MSHTIKHNPKEEVNAAKEYYEHAKESVKDARDYVSDKAGEYSNTIKSHVNDTEEKLIKYTKSNPLKALSFAALIGYVISKII